MLGIHSIISQGSEMTTNAYREFARNLWIHLLPYITFQRYWPWFVYYDASRTQKKSSIQGLLLASIKMSSNATEISIISFVWRMGIKRGCCNQNLIWQYIKLQRLHMIANEQLKIKKTFTSKQKDASRAIATVQSSQTCLYLLHISSRKSQHELVEKLAWESDKARYWCEIFLIYPLLPYCKALSTITVGGVIVNVASTTCNTNLLCTSPYQALWPDW